MRTEIERTEGKLVKNFDMQAGGAVAGTDGRKTPNNILKVAIDSIVDVAGGMRQRKTDTKWISQLQEDIKMQVLLQPIGLRREKDGFNYEIIWGYHRYLAFKKGWEEAKELLKARGEKDPEAYMAAKMWQTIPAVIHDWMPNDQALLKEIAENLLRLELSPRDVKIQRVKYAAMVKKFGETISADQKRAEKQAAVEAKKKTGDPSDLGHRSAVQSKPTVIEKTAADLGVTKETVRTDFAAVSAMANAAVRDMGGGVTIKVTPESPVEKIEEAVVFASMAVAEHVPVTKTPETEIIYRIDLTDPKKMVQWFKQRVDSAEKPLTLDFLEIVAVDLLAFVKERRG